MTDRDEGMAYHVSLDSFEGPMDLLLHLISQARIEIREIFVSPIIDQYLDFMEQMPVEHMERTSEFVAMAARLLEIKSRWLLPKPSVQEEDPDQLENDLIRQLELYRQYKQARGLLRQKQQQAELVFYRLPEERYQEERIEPGNLTLEKLVAAFERMQLRLAQPDRDAAREDHIQRDAFTVREKVLHITRRLKQSGRIGFLSLFEGASTREEVIVTFLALLEMAKNNLVLVEQRPEDADIIITQRKEQTPDGAEPISEDRGN